VRPSDSWPAIIAPLAGDAKGWFSKMEFTKYWAGGTSKVWRGTKMKKAKGMEL
jgi:hypothetical protein